MKKMKNLLFAMFLSAFVCSGYAQQSEPATSEMQSQKKDNWFVSIGGGANLLIAEQDGDVSMSERFKVGGELSVGKWFNPVFGARVQINGGSLRGFNYQRPYGSENQPKRYFLNTNRDMSQFPIGFDREGYLQNGKNHADQALWSKFKTVKGDDGLGYWQEFEYASASIDLMANLTNLFRGYHYDKNTFDVIPYIGMGWIHAIKSNSNPTYDAYFTKLGIRFAYNINPSWGVYIEPQANITNEDFDGYVGERGYDMIANLYLGVQYSINRGFANPSCLSSEEIDYLNRRINENRFLIENHQDILERQQNLLNKLEECCEDQGTEIIVKEKVFLPEYIRFGLDSYQLISSEKSKIEDVAAYLDVNQEARLLMVGYADKLTGNPKYNMELSRKRVEAVANELKRLNIDPDRMVLKWLGDTEQPYDHNDLNRVVVMVER